MTPLGGLFGGATGASLAGPYANQGALSPNGPPQRAIEQQAMQQAMQLSPQMQQQNSPISRYTTEILIREVSGGKIIEVYSKPNNHRVTRVCKEDDNLMEQIAAAYTEARLGNS